jgi:3-phosphoshikimate 1-carboxyvinyltransferase
VNPPVEWTIEPSRRLRGEIRVPGDKSVSHRALILNAVAHGTANIRGLLRAEDVGCTAAALRALGVRIEDDGEFTTVHGQRGAFVEPDRVIDCGNSGTSIRLLAGMLAAQPVFAVFTGDDSLRRRPMRRVLEPLQHMGARVDGRGEGKYAPFSVRGGDLRTCAHDLAVASAQVKSALLLAGLRCGVAVREPGPSRDHTERMLRRMGAALRETPDRWLHLAPDTRLDALDVDVPGDLSAAAFFLVAGSIAPDAELCLRGVGINPTRAGVLNALTSMGADLRVVPVEASGAEPVADLWVRSSALRGIRIDGALALRCLDELPVLAIAAAFAEGETVIADAAELRVKESDRIARVATGLRALGIEVEERPDGMVIQGGAPAGPATIDATGDHRIAMAFSVAGLFSRNGLRVMGADSVTSSYPDFRQELEGLRA